MQTAVLDAQNKNEFNVHRGYIRTIPVLREITTMLQVLFRFIGLCLYKLYDRKTPVYKDGLKHGLFTPPKTTTQEKIDILNSELEDDLNRTKPFQPYQDGRVVCVVSDEHIEFTPRSSLKSWSKY